MICAEDELGIGESHDGILVLAPETEIGLPAMQVLNAYEDDVFEIGLTPNRSDANGHIGVARDIVAALRVREGKNIRLTMPDLSSFLEGSGTAPISVKIKDTEVCPRYTGITLEDVVVGDSPDWIKQRLIAIGQRPINNIVDITNYILHEYGQPLHAFDADQIHGNEVVVSTLSSGTAFFTLDETERKLDAQDLMICDASLNPMCIAGVFGGLKSGVTLKTKRIFLESAHFKASSIRRTSQRHGLLTDAAKAYEKGTDPNITVDALKRAVLLMQQYASAKVAGPIVDVYPQPVEKAQVDLDINYVSKLTGISFTKELVVDILLALEMELKDNGDGLLVLVPTDKPDILRPADLVEEILRIYGLDKVPVSDKMLNTISYQERPNAGDTINLIADFLAARGFNEMMALSMSQSAYFTGSFGMDKETLVLLNNTSNSHLNVMRPNLIASGLESIQYNLNRKQNDLRLFEIGRSYKNEGEGYSENEEIVLWMSGRSFESNWLQKAEKISFYSIKSAVHQVLDRTACTGYQFESINNNIYEYGLRYFRGNAEIVSFGKISSALLKTFDIKQEVYAAIFNWESLWNAIRKNTVIVQEISRFPAVKRDLALVLNTSVAFSDIEKLAFKTEKNYLTGINLFDIYVNEEQLGKGKKSCAISLTLQSATQTLTEKEIDDVVSRLIVAFESKLGAVIRK
jgi:phenylalanyl-tRNA synthetase beta chain